jgi:hypothetical protein
MKRIMLLALVFSIKAYSYQNENIYIGVGSFQTQSNDTLGNENVVKISNIQAGYYRAQWGVFFRGDELKQTEGNTTLSLENSLRLYSVEGQLRRQLYTKIDGLIMSQLGVSQQSVRTNLFSNQTTKSTNYDLFGGIGAGLRLGIKPVWLSLETHVSFIQQWDPQLIVAYGLYGGLSF